jgi:TolA-binding protein
VIFYYTFDQEQRVVVRTLRTTSSMDKEIAYTQETILKVERDIEKTEREIDEVTEELKRVDPADAERLQYLRKDKEQLRKDKEQLRTKEEQLRKKEEQLRKKEEQPEHPMARMRRLLQGSSFEVNDDVLSCCARNSWLAARLTCVSTAEDALKLYADAEAIPQSQTRARAKEQGVTIDGPMQFAGAQTASFFRAFENTKLARVLKVNNEASKSRSECRLYAALGASAEKVEIALVPVKLLELDNSSEHQSTRASPPRKMSPFLGLLMPCYAYSFDDLPAPIPSNYAFEVFRRIIAAIDYIHDHGWLHGDVKPGNIFCDWNGEAWLGDYGSSVPHDQLRTFTGGTPKYQCSDVSHLDRARLFDGVGLVLSLLEWLGVLVLRGGGGTLCLDKVLEAVSELPGPDGDALKAALFDWVANLRAL